MPYHSIEDFVQDLRTATLARDGLDFVWPADQVALQHMFYTMLHYLVPGTFGVLTNRMPIPTRFLKPEAAKRRLDKVSHLAEAFGDSQSLKKLKAEAQAMAETVGGFQKIEDEELNDNCRIEFCGVPSLATPHIMRYGLLPTTGAGDDEVAQFYGTMVPRVYTSDSITTSI